MRASSGARTTHLSIFVRWQRRCRCRRRSSRRAARDDRGQPYDDPALWIGTSGTTGIPKGVVHAHRVAHEPHSFAQRVLNLTCGDRLYATSKLFFAYALANSLFAGLKLGATVILDRERPTPERVGDIVARHRPTVLFTVPTLYNKMLQQGVASALRGCS